MVVVGWFGRASTTLHYIHHVSHAGSRDTRVSFFFKFVLCVMISRVLCVLPFCCSNSLSMVGFVELLRDKIAGKDGEVATEIALTGRTAVALYFSAH